MTPKTSIHWGRMVQPAGQQVEKGHVDEQRPRNTDRNPARGVTRSSSEMHAALLSATSEAGFQFFSSFLKNNFSRKCNKTSFDTLLASFQGDWCALEREFPEVVANRLRE